MANRYYTQFVSTLQKGIVEIYARVTFGAAGAPTIDRSGYQSQGLVSVTRDNQGIFTFVFGTSASSLDTYYKLLGVDVLNDTIGAAGVPAAPLHYLSGNSIATVGTASVQITFTDDAGATATDPGDGEAIMFCFKFKNSTSP